MSPIRVIVLSPVFSPAFYNNLWSAMFHFPIAKVDSIKSWILKSIFVLVEKGVNEFIYSCDFNA
jgi:hypothetical protein